MSGDADEGTSAVPNKPAEAAPVQSPTSAEPAPAQPNYERPASWEQIDSITKGAEPSGETREE